MAGQVVVVHPDDQALLDDPQVRANLETLTSISRRSESERPATAGRTLVVMATAPTTELGNVRSWSQLAAMSDETEAEPSLRWPLSVPVFDRMRKYSQIRAVLWALTLPLRRNIWSLDPQGARPEVVARLAEQLDLPVLGQPRQPRPRAAGRFSWSEHLRLSLLALPFGHMFFEITGEVVNGSWVLTKLSPRFPQTIAAMNVERDGGLASIEQHDEAARGGSVTIPVDRLVAYVIDREGGSWAGTSVLRAAYGDWLIHDRLMRVNAQSIERNGMGVPNVEVDAGVTLTAAQRDEALAAAQAYRSGAHSAAIWPAGTHLVLKGVEGTIPDALPTLSYHDVKIAKSVQGQFMELGTNGSTGNRALGGVFVDTFATAVDGIATQIADTTTAHVVEDWVDWNYGGAEPAPKVVAQPVDAETDLPPEAIGELIARGALTMDDDLEAYLRNRGKLPAKREASVITPAATEALGSLIRAGFEPAAAATALGLPPIAHTGRLPVTVQGAGGGAPVAASGSSTVPAGGKTGTRVAASAPGSEPYAEKLTSYYAPKIAGALADATDPAAIVAALEEA